MVNGGCVSCGIVSCFGSVGSCGYNCGSFMESLKSNVNVLLLLSFLWLLMVVVVKILVIWCLWYVWW